MIVQEEESIMKAHLAKIGIIAAVALLVPALLQADVYLKQKQHTDAYEVMGQNQPAEDLVTEIWIAKDKMASNSEKQGFIIRLDKNVSYIIDHEKKTYIEMPADMSQMAAGMDDEDAAGMQKMMAGMLKMEVSITPTGEKKKIGAWQCKKYIQKIESFMGPMQAEIWASDELKIDNSMYARYASAMFARMPGMQSVVENMMKEMKKIEGVPVLTEASNNVMGQTIRSTTQLLEAGEGNAPAGVFDLPAGYKKTNM